jgi:hypothetical protein
MNCCAECFGDRGLRKDLIPSRSTETGRCSYCGSENVKILPPKELADYFGLLIGAYKKDETGKLLVQWLREDWLLFEHPSMDDSRAKDLLAEILDDGEIVRQKFVPVGSFGADPLKKWEDLREELMHRNRFFPKANIDLEQLEDLLVTLTLPTDEIPGLWYRARIQTGEAPFRIADMGAPPEKYATHGRANPAGIPYLYLGSTPLAVISEIRPHTGEIVCVADFKTHDGLNLVDLRHPRKMVSPFLLEDAEAIGRMRSHLPFLERLGDELTRPIVPQSAAIDYTPSQYLCEFIKKCGYKGVIYRSSVSDGMNLALFDPAQATSDTVKQYRVTRVTVDTAATGT